MNLEFKMPTKVLRSYSHLDFKCPSGGIKKLISQN